VAVVVQVDGGGPWWSGNEWPRAGVAGWGFRATTVVIWAAVVEVLGGGSGVAAMAKKEQRRKGGRRRIQGRGMVVSLPRTTFAG
jgi:hypothetical protein